MTVSAAGLGWLIYGAIGVALLAPLVLIVLWYLDHRGGKLW